MQSKRAKWKCQNRAICLLDVEQHIDKPAKFQQIQHCVDEDKFSRLLHIAVEGIPTAPDGRDPGNSLAAVAALVAALSGFDQIIPFLSASQADATLAQI